MFLKKTGADIYCKSDQSVLVNPIFWKKKTTITKKNNKQT